MKALLAAAAAVFVLGLGANSIWDANEAFYVDTPRTMVESGDYVTPTFNGELRLNKPVLSYWIVAGFYRVLGPSVPAERIAIAVGALGLLAVTFVIGRAFRPATGVLAALILATAPRVVHFARRNLIDVYLTLFMTLALAAFVLAIEQPARRRRYLLFMYVAIGLGVLTKGPVAFVLPALVITIWLGLERRMADLKHLQLVPGALIVLAIVVPWYAILQVRHGWGPIWDFFVGENLGRYTSAVTTARNPAFFLGVLFGDILLPWAPLLVVPMWTGWRTGGIRRLLWLWVAVIVGVFCVSASKEDLYILPVAPAAAVLIADALVRTEFGREHGGLRTILALVCVIVAALGGLVLWVFGDGYYRIVDAPLVALVLVAGGLGALALVVGRRPAAGFVTLATAFVVFNWLFVLRVLPGVEPLKPVPPLAAAIATRASPNAPVASHQLSLPSLIYYLGRPVVELPADDEAVRFVTDHAEAWIVTGQSEWDRLRARVPNLCVAWRRPRFDTRLTDILRRTPPPDVLLVTNRCGSAPLPAR